MEEQRTLNGIDEESYIQAWVQVRQMLNDAYGEEYVTANPILIAAGIIAEALYGQSQAILDIHYCEGNIERLIRVIDDGFVGMSRAITDELREL